MKRFFKWVEEHKGGAVVLTACILLVFFIISLFISEVISPDEELRYKVIGMREECYLVEDTVGEFKGYIFAQPGTFTIVETEDGEKYFVPVK